MPLRGNVLRRGSRVDSSSTNDKLAIKDSAQQQQQKKKNASVFVSAPPLLHPLHMSGINLTSIFLQAEQKPSRTYTVGTANWFWMPVRNTNPMAKIGPWKLECAHTNHLSPLGPCHSPDLLAAAPLGCSLRLAKQALLYGLLPSCVCMPMRMCVCVFGPSSTWLLQPPAQGTKGNTRLISSLF